MWSKGQSSSSKSNWTACSDSYYTNISIEIKEIIRNVDIKRREILKIQPKLIQIARKKWSRFPAMFQKVTLKNEWWKLEIKVYKSG